MVTLVEKERRNEGSLITMPKHICLPVPEQIKHDNRAILQELEQQSNLLTLGCYAAGVGALAGVAFFSPLVPASMPPVAMLLGKLQTISQQVMLMRRLIEAFEVEEIEIHPRLNPPDLQQIDFFLRFPDKKFVVLKIVSLGDSVVSFNKTTERLQYRSDNRWIKELEPNKKRARGLKNWEPDPLSVLNLQVLWIARERRDLKGGSSRDARRPVAKMLVLQGATKLGNKNEDLYSTMSGYRALWIKKFGSVCIVEEDQVIDAIKAYLTNEREQEQQIKA